MTPHAISPPPSEGKTSPGVLTPNGSYDGSYDRPSAVASILPSTAQEELHDLICVGFGPASLAIAVAIHDFVEANPGREPPKVAFVEKQESFAWHAGMQLPGATMQISWIKDFATMRNPRSHFTFLNYLHESGRLVRFSNLGTFLPQRIEYEAYMKWAASHFSHLVGYGQEGVDVLPCRSGSSSTSSDGSGEPVNHWAVRTRNVETGAITEMKARHVVLSLGGRPRLPPYLPQSNPRVVHSSKFMSQVPSVLPDKEAPYNLYIIGSGQSSAEIFHNLYSTYPNAKVRLLIRGRSLKPSDDSPFVNETFNPERVDDVFAMQPDLRKAGILDEKATNYGVVRLELLEKIYADMYEESVRFPERKDEDLRARVLPFREVTAAESIDGDRIRVQIKNDDALHRRSTKPESVVDVSEADILIVAAGYQRDAHEDMLQGAKHLMPASSAKKGKWTAGRDYGVEFAEGKVAKNSGVWLQGCNEGTHGLSDTLLSILSIRGGELVDSIFGGK